MFIVGDTHGNGRFWERYLFPMARRHHADVIVQVGDFGFWEHEAEGSDYLDALDALAAQDPALVVHALHGNHDNWPLVMQRYGHDRDGDGFVRVRERIRYIPQGHIWTWAGLRMRAFGGAYSLDKAHRLTLERKRTRQAYAKENGRREQGQPPRRPRNFAGTLWFPNEQMTNSEFAELMVADTSDLDVVVSHDKPRSSNPGIRLKDEPECWPNQDRLQLALTVHRPRLWLHGHLHHPYVDTVRCGDDDWFTKVIGLSCDDEAASRFWRPTDAWGVLDVLPNGTPVFAWGSLLEDAAEAAGKAFATLSTPELVELARVEMAKLDLAFEAEDRDV